MAYAIARRIMTSFKGRWVTLGISIGIDDERKNGSFSYQLWTPFLCFSQMRGTNVDEASSLPCWSARLK
jgi:hypothetical protein